MNYCIPYKISTEEAEARIPLAKLSQLPITTRAVIPMHETVNFDLLDKEHNYTFATRTYADLRKTLRDGRNAFLDFPVTDWETFNQLRDLGVSDIWIDGALCFQLDRLARAKKDVHLRVSPQISLNNITPNPTSFFIRPEDLSMYDEVIDTVDFHVEDLELSKTLYNIYKRGLYISDLSILVKTLGFEVLNPTIPSEFTKNRLNCGQSCQIPGRSCHLCENYLRTASLMSKRKPHE